MSRFEQTVAQLERTGQATYAAWNARAWAALVQAPAARLWQALGADDDAGVAALRAYLRLGQEALAREVVRESGDAPGLLGRLWLQVIPQLGGSVPAEQLPARLVELWNLGEGLRDEGRWLDHAVGRRIDGLGSLSEVEPAVEAVLEEILSPGPDPSWARGACTIVDLRPVSDGFVPGWMHLLAPRVVCVHDRRHDDQRVGVWLQAEGPCELLGLIDCGDTHHDPRPAPRFTVEGGGLGTLGKHRVLIPWLYQVHASLVVPSGYAVASAVDSQWLWVVRGG